MQREEFVQNNKILALNMFSRKQIQKNISLYTFTTVTINYYIFWTEHVREGIDFCG